jgi:Txe/YoeB family toxin of Txe-Axe toxin-antitoxin module
MKDKIKNKYEKIINAIEKTPLKETEELYLLTEALDNLTGVYVRIINLEHWEKMQKNVDQLQENINVYADGGTAN